jgi:hypothetical protein
MSATTATKTTFEKEKKYIIDFWMILLVAHWNYFLVFSIVNAKFTHLYKRYEVVSNFYECFLCFFALATHLLIFLFQTLISILNTTNK